MRNEEIRKTFAHLMSEVCYDVATEPKPQSLQGESPTDEDAPLDVKADGL